MGLTVSQSPSSACAHMPRLFQSPSSACAHMPRLFHGRDCFTVSTCCMYIDLGSRGYFGVNVALVFIPDAILTSELSNLIGGGWGCEVSCGGHHRPRGKTTTGSALDGAVFDIAQILAYLVHNMSRSQLYLGFGHFGWLSSFFGQ